MHNKPQEVMIATVGVEPQVVTLTLDLLLSRSFQIKEVALLYTSYPMVLSAIEKLKREFDSAYYRNIKMTAILIANENEVFEDFRSAEDVNSMLNTMYKVISEYRKKGSIIHLSIAGGRKLMGIMAIVTAQILFGAKDHVWYLITEGWKPGGSRNMHCNESGKHILLEVPLVRWDESYLLLDMAEFVTPSDLLHWQENLSQNVKMRRRREFVERWLSKAERQVVFLACQGLDNANIAKRLHKQERTVANQLTSVYEKLYEWLGFPDCKIDRSIMIAELAPYFTLKKEGIVRTSY